MSRKLRVTATAPEGVSSRQYTEDSRKYKNLSQIAVRQTDAKISGTPER
jgi:hypothetical protein